MDKVGNNELPPPPDVYFEYKAAKDLGMSFWDLHNHPEKESLLEVWNLCESGGGNGEMILQYQVDYWRKVKTHLDRVEAARKQAGF